MSPTERSAGAGPPLGGRGAQRGGSSPARAARARRRPAHRDDHRRAGRDPRRLDGLAAMARDPGRGGRAGAHPVGLDPLGRARLGPADPARGRARPAAPTISASPGRCRWPKRACRPSSPPTRTTPTMRPTRSCRARSPMRRRATTCANLVTGGKIDPTELAALQRLCETVGLSADVANADRGRPARRLTAAAPPDPAASGASARRGHRRRTRQPAAHAPLGGAADLAGHRPGAVRAARALRRDPAARRPASTSTPPRARCWSRRSRASTWPRPSASSSRASGCRSSRLADLQALAPALPAASFDRIATGSDFFEVRGRLRLGDVVLEQRSLVQRRGRRRSRCCSASGSPAATAWAREPVQKCAAILRRRHNRAT